MNQQRAVRVVIPDEAPLNPDFEERLGDLMAEAFGWDWQLHEWYELDEGTSETIFEFVFLPDPRSVQERLNEFAARASQALNAALPEINEALHG